MMKVILELEREYYITLYETKNPDPIKIEEYIEATNIENKLSRDESNVAEGELTIEECSKSQKEFFVFFTFFYPFYS
jgi:hypothetical protein